MKDENKTMKKKRIEEQDKNKTYPHLRHLLIASYQSYQLILNNSKIPKFLNN